MIETTRRYAVGIEKTNTGFSAFVPDLGGCVATVRNKAEVEPEMKDAIRFHVDGMMEDGISASAPTSVPE
jgi:predicted RNase H-like HicB family nuclease